MILCIRWLGNCMIPAMLLLSTAALGITAYAIFTSGACRTCPMCPNVSQCVHRTCLSLCLCGQMIIAMIFYACVDVQGSLSAHFWVDASLLHLASTVCGCTILSPSHHPTSSRCPCLWCVCAGCLYTCRVRARVPVTSALAQIFATYTSVYWGTHITALVNSLVMAVRLAHICLWTHAVSVCPCTYVHMYTCIHVVYMYVYVHIQL